MFSRFVILVALIAALAGCATKPYTGPRDNDPVWVNNAVQEVAIDLREDGDLDRKWQPWVSAETRANIIERAEELNRNHVGQ